MLHIVQYPYLIATEDDPLASVKFARAGAKSAAVKLDHWTRSANLLRLLHRIDCTRSRDAIPSGRPQSCQMRKSFGD